jgi:S1-C subfamily serine protease
VNLVDLLILAAVIGAAAHGFLLGAATQVLSFGGAALGFVIGASLAPGISRLGHDPATKAALALLSLFGFSIVLGTVGREVGVRLWGRLGRRPILVRLDASGGALLAALAAVTASWLVGSVLATAPARTVASEVQHSAFLRALNRLLPPAPPLFSRLQRLIDEGGLPQVFAELEPQTAGRLPLPADPLVREAAARAAASTVKIVGEACGLIQEGSGFVAAPGLVITNAHVVAGVRSPTVVDGTGSHQATTILFDPNLDVAVLSAGGLSEPPLDLLDSNVPRGTDGAVLGYPGGGPLDVEPAAVLARIDAVGRNIYGEGLTTRSVYEIESRVRPGNSGGPLVEPDGTVVGVVFARSSLNNDVGYTLTSAEVRPKLSEAEAHESPVGTGQCTAG